MWNFFQLSEINIYRPQRSMGKVMFSQACVILFTGGGVCLSACWDTTPPRADTPSGSRHSPGADTPPGRHPPEQSPHRADPPEQTPPEQTPPGSRHPPGRTCWEIRSYWNAILSILFLLHTLSQINSIKYPKLLKTYFFMFLLNLLEMAELMHKANLALDRNVIWTYDSW